MVDDGDTLLSLDGDVGLTLEEALQLGKLIGVTYKKVTVSRDSNPSSRMMKDALISGLLSAGADVWDAGVAPSPVAVLVGKDSDCIVVVTLPDQIGLSRVRIFNNDGSALCAEQTRALLKRMDDKVLPLPKYKGVGTIRSCNMVAEKYIKVVTKGYKNVNCPMVLDCGCGCTSICAPQILATIGADLSCMNSQTDEDYVPRSPGVEKTDVADLCELVSSSLGSVGIAFNGDGTRLAFIDEGGRYISSEETLSLLLLYTKPSIIVIPVDFTAMVDDAFWGEIGDSMITDATEMNVRRIIRVEATDDAIIKAAKEESADLAVLANGAFIFPKVSLCPDAIIASVILTEMAGRNSVRNLIASFPRYVILNDVVHFTGNHDIISKKLNEKIAGVKSKGFYDIDGWKVDMEEGWFTISFSKDVSDYIDIMAESRDKAYSVTMLEMAKRLVLKSI